MTRASHSLRQLAMCLGMLAALLPSVMLLLPVAYGQPMGMAEHCDMAGMTEHAQPTGSGTPATPDQNHECHCLLCVVHAVDIGLPPGIVHWHLSDRADAILAQATYQPYVSAVWLISEPRGPPTSS
ncbi:MAG: hypothetical protein JWQ69_862 [Pseudomonas sp.]|nr:hypothetical protein [Pseudomonas sp.]